MKIIVAIAFVNCLAAAQAYSQQPTSHRLIPISTMSQDVEVLFGNPDVAGESFVMRIRELPGGVIPPHKHPVDEHITVVQGTLFFGVGEKFDKAAMTELKAGSYAFIPKGSTMFGYTPEAAIVQVHGVGPFHIHWRAGDEWREDLITLDHADAASVFMFRRGERVVTKRGSGTVRQGYDSGEMIGYEIDGEDGSLFMALEEDMERAAPDASVNQDARLSASGVRRLCENHRLAPAEPRRHSPRDHKARRAER